MLLHVHPFNLPVPLDEIWARTTALPLGGGCEARALDPTLELMRVCDGARRVGWIADALAIARTATVDWELVERFADRWRLRQIARPLAELHAAIPTVVPVVPLSAPLDWTGLLGARARWHIGQWQRYRRLRAMGMPHPGGFVGHWREARKS